MIVVQFRVVILHRVPISTHNIFSTPYIPQNPYKSYRSYRFYNLTDTLQTMCRHMSYILQTCRLHRGPDIFSCTLHRLLHRCFPQGLENCAAGGREGLGAVASRARGHAGTARFPSFLPGKVKIFRPEKISKNLLAHSAPRPDQFYGLEPCEMAGRKWGAASPRSCVPLSQMSQCEVSVD